MGKSICNDFCFFRILTSKDNMAYSHPQHSLTSPTQLYAEDRALGMPLQMNDYCPRAPCSSVSLNYDFFGVDFTRKPS